MATLTAAATADNIRTKQKAVEEARKVQVSVTKECIEAGRDPPSYILSELIGKGSFGRVYKATSTKTRKLVAIKIISIDEGDSLSPGAADTFSDILKEVNTLKRLGNSGAENINTILDTLLNGSTIWIITDYCAGGSVATLMRPTGRGLPEMWIVPILREVAKALSWVHREGIIHRITEVGAVQLCDFGVAGIIENRFDKRNTVTGTLQWMAPEFFDTTVLYGVEIDIWAFGSMAYEVATGMPPNATAVKDISQFGSYLKEHCPRLEGDKYSSRLKDLVAYCLVPDPAGRPRIEQVQRHDYIHNTSEQYPTILLSELVGAYKVWEAQGGNRQSLFSAGGAQGPISRDSALMLNNDDNEWKFSTLDESSPQVMDDVDLFRGDSPPQLPRSRPRRRRPPNTKAPTAPLEKVFDPNTISNYQDNARIFYGRHGPRPSSPSSTNDLPLRDISEQSSVRESLIDLDASWDGIEPSGFTELETIRSRTQPSFSAPEDSGGWRTLDWTFPTASAGLDVPFIPSARCRKQP
jgi:serine/threonine protein kinase